MPRLKDLKVGDCFTFRPGHQRRCVVVSQDGGRRTEAQTEESGRKGSFTDREVYQVPHWVEFGPEEGETLVTICKI